MRNYERGLHNVFDTVVLIARKPALLGVSALAIGVWPKCALRETQLGRGTSSAPSGAESQRRTAGSWEEPTGINSRYIISTVDH